MSERLRRMEADHEMPWSMPIVVRRSKKAIARHIDVVEAVAMGVATFLDDPRNGEDGIWREATDYWQDGVIRKVVRRGDGQKFADAKALGCVEVAHGGNADSAPAEALIFPPGPLEPMPRELAKLQVGGTEFPDEGTSSVPEAEAVVIIELSPLVTLTTGKAAAQCGHAAQRAYETMPAEVRDRWRQAGFLVRVDVPARDVWSAGGRPVSITDAGLTEVDGPTETVRARW